MNNLDKFFYNQNTASRLLISFSAIGIVAFFLIAAIFPFRDAVLDVLYPKPQSQASSNVDLSFTPSTVSVAPGQEFDINVTMNSHTFHVAAGLFDITFDPAKLQGVSMTEGTALPVVLPGGAGKFTNGVAHIELGANAGQNFNGTATVVKLRFKALTASTTPVTLAFTSGTQIAAIESNTDVSGDKTPGTVTIAAPSAAAFSLQTIQPGNPLTGQQFSVRVLARSDNDAANLFSARLKYNTTFLDAVSIDTQGSIIGSGNWAEQVIDNQTGQVSVTGGVPNPGVKTNGTDALFVTIVFRAKAVGTTFITFDTSSGIFSNATNTNILTSSPQLALTLAQATAAPTPTVPPATNAPTPTSAPTSGPTSGPTTGPSTTPGPTSAPTSVPTPGFQKGDGNRDRVINRFDLSVLLSNYNGNPNGVSCQRNNPASCQNGTFNDLIDMNDDGVINAFDYIAHVGLLKSLGEIK